MVKPAKTRGPGQPRKNKPQYKARYIRNLPDDIYYDFMAFCKKRGHTIGEELVELMRARIII